MARITTPQIRKIYATARELKIDELEFRKTGRKKQRGYNRASEDQKNKIRKLEEALGWKDNPKRLRGFMKKYAKVEKLDWLTTYQASNLIEALKKVLMREHEKISQDNVQKYGEVSE